MQTFIRHGIGSIRPYLHGPLELPEFVCQVFGAVVLERHDFNPESCHVELQIADSVVVIEAGKLPPEVAPWQGMVYIYVKDVDATYTRALQLGAKPISPPSDKPFNERQAGFLDAAGNTWWIGSFKG